MQLQVVFELQLQRQFRLQLKQPELQPQLSYGPPYPQAASDWDTQTLRGVDFADDAGSDDEDYYTPHDLAENDFDDVGVYYNNDATAGP